MPTWLQDALSNIRPIASKGEGLVKLGQEIAQELKDPNMSTTAKIIAIAEDLIAMASQIEDAINESTPGGTPEKQEPAS